MKQKSIMQMALKDQWKELPQSLKAHYQGDDNADVGKLSIEYPKAMQLPLNLLKILGALINRAGNEIPATVEKSMRRDKQYWRREINFLDGRKIVFKSVWQYHEGNELIEFVNRFIGLRMAVKVEDEILRYEGKGFELRLGKLRLSIPEWMLLGHTSIEEKAIDESHFEMDFRLHHPLFGQIYRYSGTFITEKNELFKE
jgi:hypothetical protein